MVKTEEEKIVLSPVELAWREIASDLGQKRKTLKHEFERKDLDYFIDNFPKFLREVSLNGGKFSLAYFKDRGSISHNVQLVIVREFAPDESVEQFVAEVPEDIIDWRLGSIKNIRDVLVGETKLPSVFFQKQIAEVEGEPAVLGLWFQVRSSRVIS